MILKLEALPPVKDGSEITHHDILERDEALAVLVQALEGQAEVPVVHLALRQARGDEVVPVDGGLALAHAHRVEDVDHLLLGQSPEASRGRVPDQDLLQGAQRDLSRAIPIVLFELLAQALREASRTS